MGEKGRELAGILISLRARGFKIEEQSRCSCYSYSVAFCATSLTPQRSAFSFHAMNASFVDSIVGASGFAMRTYGVLVASWLLPCLFFDAIEPHIQSYKINPNVKVDPKLRKKAIRMSITNFAWLPFALLVAAPFLEAKFDGSAPFPLLVLAQVATSFLIDDCCFYVYHRILHEQPTLYRKFHKPHHQFVHPFVWSSHATHPVEMLLQGVGGMMGPLLWASFSSYGMHPLAFWIWLCVRQLQGVFDHTGYDIDPFALIPGVGGTKFHDDHHKYFVKNYASMFSFIDDIFGTSSRPKSKKR